LFSDLDNIEKEISTEERVPIKRKTQIKPRKRQFQFKWLIGIVSVAVIAVVGYVLVTQIIPEGKMRWKDSIAVLPIEDQSQNKDQNLLCDGMTFNITGKLSGIEGLKVIPYREVGRYKDEGLSYKEIGKLLGAKKILESILERKENTIKITFHLIDANEMSVIRLFEYSAEPEEIFTIPNSITTDVARTIELPLVAIKFEEDKKKDPKNTKAYGYYLSGRDFENRYGQSYEETDFTSAKKMYEEAIRIDPGYANAYFRLGILHEVKYNRDLNQEDLSLMHEYLNKAHEINPNLAESHVGLGWANFYSEDYDRAFAYFKSALQIEPYNPEINNLTGAFFLSIGLYNQAIKFYSKAIELDPLYFWNHYLLAVCFMCSGDYDRAHDYFQSAMDIEPNHIDLLSHYAFFEIFLKNYEEAETILEKVEKIGSDDIRVRQVRALLFAIKGEKEEALKLIKERLYSYCATSVYSHLGMNDEAVKNIRRGIEEGSKELNVYLYPYPFLISNPFYDNIRNDSGFREIVKEEKEKYRERQKKYGKL
jgi:tetratricopeptide (TPR) repeat protein